MDNLKLLVIRRQLGLTQTQLGSILGFSAQHISRLERDGRSITQPVALLLAIMRDEPDIAAKIIRGDYLPAKASA